jgi:hypothetical protein
MKKLILYTLITSLLIISIGCTKDQDPIEEPKPIDQPMQNGKDNDQIEEVEITSSDKVDTENLTLLDEYYFDFDKDGNQERIAMYTDAGRGPDGEIAWDDGQNWIFIVHDTDKDYVLLDDYVQLGNIDFFIYTVDDDFHIATVDGRTASLTLTVYRYDLDRESFIKRIPYEVSGNVNLIKTSYGY